MVISNYDLDPQRWAEIHFGDLDLGDLRRNQRVINIAQAMAAKPGASLPQTFSRWPDLKASYNLFAHPEALPDEVQATHRELVLEAMKEPGTVLLPEDTSEIAWDARLPITGLGPVGASKDKQIGFLLHTALAVSWPAPDQLPAGARRPPVKLLGIADQQYYVRQPQPAGETRKARLSRERESELWEQTTYRLGDKPADEAVRWVRVTDRGSDIYEYLRSCEECGHGYVVRAAQDRALLDEEGRPAGTLFETARAQAALGEIELELRGRQGKPARRAQLQISAVEVCIRAPYRPGYGLGQLPPIRCTVVRVWEEKPPAGEEALEWILLCDGQRTSFELGRECAQQYNARWLCEEFHKALKTGLKVEELQLETGEALMSATAVKSVVALRLLDLREHARQEPEAPAEQSGLNEVELEVLAAKTGRQIQTVREVVLALGHLGGHLNRKRDGLPGWITLWRGWLQLQALVEGFLLAHKRKKFG
ncbi:MAG: IS4 family transposase [Blastocatellia bacterium]